MSIYKSLPNVKLLKIDDNTIIEADNDFLSFYNGFYRIKVDKELKEFKIGEYKLVK